MYRVNQRGDVLGRCELGNSVAKVEDMASLRRTVTVEDLSGLRGDRCG